MARNFYRIFTENNPVMGDSKTFGIPEAKGLMIRSILLRISTLFSRETLVLILTISLISHVITLLLISSLQHFNYSD